MNRYVGVDIGGTKMYMMAEAPDGIIEHRAPTGAGCTRAQMKQALDDFIAQLPYTPDGIGMGIPGLVDGSDKVEMTDLLTTLNGVTADYFATDCPVAFINDVKAAAIAGAADHAESHTVAVIMAGTGIAVGVVEKGELLLGSRGWSGEMGYMMLATDSANGKAERIDNLAGGYAILQQAGTDVTTFLQQLEDGDEHAASIIRRAGFYFGLSLTNVLHLYNPDVIVVGGSASTYKGYMEAALETLRAHALPELLACCTITQPKDLKRIVALGAREWVRKLNARAY
ncbi:ROK family protein [Paenibacillus marinisediminis]